MVSISMDHVVLPHQSPCKKIKMMTRIEDLPREIVLDVLSRLSITSLVQFRLVCHSWRSLAQDPLLVDLHLSHTATRSPFLVLHSDYPIRNQLGFVELSAAVPDGTRDDGLGASFQVRRFSLPLRDTMPEFDVVGSCNGLLCLADSLYREPLRVYNPFTRQFRDLPESRHYPDLQDVVFGFGYSPTTKQYKVIKSVYYYANSLKTSFPRRPRRLRQMQSDVQVLTLGVPRPSWRSLGKAPYQIERKQPETFLHGRLHWVTGPRRYRSARQIVSFDIVEEQFLEIPKPDGGSLAGGNYQLGVLRGCLLAVAYCNYRRMEIWAMKTYGVKESWAKEYNVGAYMPKGLKQNANLTIMKMWKNHSGRVARVLCEIDGGEILLEYKSRALVAFDPKKGKFRDVVLKGLPSWFHAFVHVGSLCWT